MIISKNHVEGGQQLDFGASKSPYRRETKVQQNPECMPQDINHPSPGNSSYSSWMKDVSPKTKAGHLLICVWSDSSFTYPLHSLAAWIFGSWIRGVFTPEGSRTKLGRRTQMEKAPPGIALELFSLSPQLLPCPDGLPWLKDCAKDNIQSALIYLLRLRQNSPTSHSSLNPSLLSPTMMLFLLLV